MNAKTTKKAVSRDPDMLPEYDFKGGIRGKYAGSYAKGTNVVVLEPDVAEVYPDSKAVNRALRQLIKAARKPTKQSTGD